MSDFLTTLASELEASLGEGLKLRRDVEAASLTTFGIGASIPVLAEPCSIEGLTGLLNFCRSNQVNYRVLGGGSNIILPDVPISFLVIKLGSCFRGREISKVPEQVGYDCLLSGIGRHSTIEGATVDKPCHLLVGSGMPVIPLARETTSLGYSGLECASGIPGTIGGAVRMNAGAHGWDFGQVTKKIWAVLPDGQIKILSDREIGWGYRSSGLTDDLVVVAALIELCGKNPATVLEKRNSVMDYRRRTQPINFPSAGSVFKNPDKRTNGENDSKSLSAGKLLDDVGLKGYSYGGVQYSTMHANWIVRINSDARQEHIMQLVEVGRTRVFEKFGIQLELEVKLW